MKEIILKSDELNHRVYIDNNIDKFHNLLLENKIKENKIKESKNLYIVIDKKVYDLYKDTIHKHIDKNKNYIYIVDSLEENKGIEQINKIYKFLLEHGANRKSVLVAIGGGILGDLSGFVAATYMRGIKFINIPTTFLSQVDSCIGGKVGYNFEGIKNLIGTFYSPCFVYVSINFLKTLSNKDFLSGLGEVIKYSLIYNINLFEFIEKNIKSIMEREPDKLLYIVRECLSIKSKFVQEDFLDLGIRNSLNFGHTVGHGIEYDSKYKISHGEAVALGILVSIKLSEKEFDFPKDIYERVINIYKKIGLPYIYKVDNYDRFLYAIKHDKKNINGINFVLLKDIGDIKVKIKINEKDLIKAIKCSIDMEEK